MPSLLDDLRKKREAAGVGAVPDIMGSSGLASALEIGVTSDPDKEIQVREDAKTLGVTPEVVRQNPAMRTRASINYIKNRVEVRRPITEEFLADPDNAAIAHDDVEALTKVEEEAGFFSNLHDFLHENVTEPIVEFGEENIYDPGVKGYKHGRLVHELGHTGHELRGTTDEATRERIQERIGDIENEMKQLGMSTDGWIGFATSAAELIGQQVGTFDQPEAAQRVMTGANMGAAYGLAIGLSTGLAAPAVAPITAGAYAVGGAFSGLVSHFATDAFIVESGHSYIDLIKQGVPEPAAKGLSIGVGVINAALEVVGASIVTKPIRDVLKKQMQKSIGEVMKRPSVRRAAARFVGNYGRAVGGETVTEVMQEGVNVAAEEIGKVFQEGPVDDFSWEETKERFEEIAVKTFKGMAVLGLPGASVGYISDRSKANRALKAQAAFRRLHGAVNESKLARRSPEAAVQHIEKSLGISTVQMPASAFNNFVTDLDVTPGDMLPSERLMKIYGEASAIDGDVTVPVGPFMKAMLDPENRALYERYQRHVRWAPGEMTATEATEFQTSGVSEVLAGSLPAVVEDQEAVEDAIVRDRVTALSDDIKAAVMNSTGIPPGTPRSVARVVEEQANKFIEGLRNPEHPASIVPTADQITEAVQGIEGIVTPEAIAEALAPMMKGPDSRPTVVGPGGKPDGAGPESRPVVVGPDGKPSTDGPDSRPIVIGPDGSVGTGPDTRPQVTGALGKTEAGGPDTRPVVVGPSGFLQSDGPDGRPIVIGPSGKAEPMGPDTRAVVVGPDGKPETGGPDSRPIVIGPDGSVGSGPDTRPVVIGPSGQLETVGPDRRPVVVGPDGKVSYAGPETRPEVVGPGGKPDTAGPETRPIVVGPSGRLETSGPDSRPIIIGPSGKLEAMGPDTRAVVVGPDGKLSTTGPDSRPVVIGPDGKLSTTGPETRPTVVGPGGKPDGAGPTSRPNNEGLRNTPEDVAKDFADTVLAAMEASMPAEQVAPIVAPVREKATVFAQGIAEQMAQPAEQSQAPILKGVDSATALAMDSLGLQALFRTAREAGMTQKQYGNYLDAIQRAANTSKNRKAVAQVKREQRQVGKDIKAAQVEIENVIHESIGNEPVYAAMRGMGREQLDRASINEAFKIGNVYTPTETEQVVRELRTAGVRVTQYGEKGVHIDEHASLYDFDAGDIMVNAMRDATPEKQEIKRRADIEVKRQRPDLFSRQADLQETITTLLHDDTSAVLAAEIGALSQDQQATRLKPKLVREFARRTMDQHQIKDVTVNKYLNNARRHGYEAGKMLRRGDRAAARTAKVNQLMSVEFAREAEARRNAIQKGKKFVAQFNKSNRKFPTLGPGYIEAIRDTISQFSIEPRLSPSKKEQLETFVQKAQDDGAHFEFPTRLLEGDKRNYQDMTLHEFDLVVQKVRELHHAGVQARQSLDQDKKNTIAVRVDGLVNAVGSKPQREQTLETRGRRQGISKTYEETKLLLLNADSVLRDLDSFQELGPAYQAIKGPIDQATTNGYKIDTNVGLINRQNAIAEKMLELYKGYTPGEMNTISKRNIKVDGFDKPISRNVFLSILLNAGNEQNRQALVESGQLTDQQISNVIDHADKRDMDFAQGMWDYLDSFWGDITGATERRRGFKPDKVQATPIETEHGIYSGGYYPLRYDNDKGVNDANTSSIEEQIAHIRFGRAIASHTRHDHTEQRVGSGGRPVMLDLFTAHSHLDMVAYDLELGDAINEVYSTLYDNRTRKAFRDAGRIETWRALDLWLGDVVTGEMHTGGVVEKSLRWLRAGFTVSKLAWNVGVAGIQIMGIIQTSVLIGKANTLAGAKDMFSSKWVGKDNIFSRVAAQSQVMAQREETFHKDIADASQLISESILRRFAPRGSIEFVNATFFYGIKKMQRMVDTWTWLAAKRAGMGKFDNDEAKAIEYADRMVIRAQASGNFQERTAFERGTVNPKLRQSETVRSFTALISYFMAKNNVAYERTKKTNFRNPAAVIGWATDMALLYVVEAALVSILRGQWPDEDESEEYGADVLAHVAGEGASSLFAGIPMIREFASEAAGFRGGGVFSSVIADTAKVIEQVGQGEIDTALLASANNLGGTLFKYPSSQINKTGRALALAGEGEDVDWIEYFMGPKFDKYK